MYYSNNDDYSLHLTISTNQNNCYGTLFKMMMNKLIDNLIQSNIEFRKNLPINIIKNIVMI